MATKRRGRGEGSIYQRKSDGRWVVNISTTVNGKRRRTPYYFETKRAAQEKLKSLQSNDIAPDNITVASYQRLWLETHSVAPETARRYRMIAETIDTYIGKARLQQLHVPDIRRFYADMLKAKLSTSARNKAGAQLRRLLRQATRDRLISYNPAEAVTLPKVEKRRFDPLTFEQVTALLEAAQPDRLYALYETALHTGARSGELFALRWKDIDFDRQQVTISKTLEEIDSKHRVKPPKSESSLRTISLPQFLVDILHEHKKEMLLEGNGSAPVFCSPRGGYLRRSNVHGRSFKPILKKAGLPSIPLHGLRHQAASIWLSDGANIKVVSKRLGHESIRITLDLYVHLMPDDDAQVSANLQRRFG